MNIKHAPEENVIVQCKNWRKYCCKVHECSHCVPHEENEDCKKECNWSAACCVEVAGE